MSLLRRLRRRHCSSRSKGHSSVSVDKSRPSSEHASPRGSLKTERAERSSRSLSRSRESDRSPAISFRTEEATKNSRTSCASQGCSEWFPLARIGSFLLATTGALAVGTAAAFGFAMVFAFLSDMFMCKLHHLRCKASHLADDCAPSKNFKSQTASDQSFPSDKSITSEACEKYPSMPDFPATDCQQSSDHAAFNTLRNLHDPNLAGPSSSAHKNVPSEDTIEGFSDSSGNLRTRFKSRSVLKHLCKKEPLSAPSSPMGSSHNKSPFSTSIVDESALNGRVPFGKIRCSADQPPPEFTPLDFFSDQEGSQAASRKDGGLLARQLSLLHQERKRRRPSPARSTWTAVGLMITIGGLFGGRVVATVGLVSWWLLVSKAYRLLTVGESRKRENSSACQISQPSQLKQGQEALFSS